MRAVIGELRVLRFNAPVVTDVPLEIVERPVAKKVPGIPANSIGAGNKDATLEGNAGLIVAVNPDAKDSAFGSVMNAELATPGRTRANWRSTTALPEPAPLEVASSQSAAPVGEPIAFDIT